MTEDPERPEEAVVEETTPEDSPDEETKKAPRVNLKNPLGVIFNIRMLRRVIQIIFLMGINAYFFVSWTGGEQFVAFWQDFRNLLPTLPIIAPLEAPAAVIAGSFDAIQREFSSGIFPFYTIGAMVIILTIIGRAPCGWVCPIGTIQDFATLPNRTKIRPSPGSEEELRQLKSVIFFAAIFLVIWLGISRLQGTEEFLINALGIFADAPFDPANPAYILFKLLPEQTFPTGIETLWYITTWGWFLLQLAFVAVILIGSWWFPRWFCRWICPAGWLYSIFSRDALIGIGRNPAKCTPDVCNTCEVVCPMNIRIRKFPYQHVYSPDCIMCLECKSHCPNNAIEIRFSG